MIGVKNLGESFAGRFDGKDYKFPAGQVTTLSEDAAAHIFGFGVEDKSRVLARNGWATTSARMDVALKRLEQFQFLAVEGIKFKDTPIPQTGPNTLHLSQSGSSAIAAK